MTAATYQFVLVERTPPVCTVKLNRPDKRNALNTPLFRELLDALHQANDDPEVRVVVLGAEGPVFCAGQDLRFTYQQPQREFEEYGALNQATRDFLRTMGKPVVARVQGDALGGGTYLATACDIIVAARHARFAMREIAAGLQSGGAHLLTIGRQRSLEMNLTGRFVGAEEAERWGLINRCVEPEELDSVVQEYVAMLADKPPLGLMYTKRATNLLLEAMGFELLQRYNREVSRILHATEDRAEAQAAFLERRKPVFKGR